MPVGLFREAERRRHLDCLAAWAASARNQELLGHGPYQVRRFGRARESERVDDLGPAISSSTFPSPARMARARS